MKKKWWKECVVYQIWPRSFKDSNGDGIGDIKGIIEKLDYLKNLGIDVIWLSPVYKSPNDDNGYDIRDYYDIMEEAGTLDDMEELIKEIHKRDMKIIMDLVVNHTSDEHHWFLNAKSSKENSYRDFYIWKKGRGDNPPNNWASIFSGSAWEYSKNTDEYYLHLFSKKQPDLNWENPDVRKEVYKIISWWLKKGIDGFRMDAINMISKNPEYPNGVVKKGEKFGNGSPYFYNGPKFHKYIKEMNREVLSKHDILTVGETHCIPIKEAQKLVDKNRNELNMIFLFDLMYMDATESKWEYKPWELTDLKEIFSQWYKKLFKKGWNSIFFNNHDQPRMVSRYGNDEKYRIESAKLLATLLLTLPGTPYIYQGEEIGMTNVKFNNINDYRDIETLNYYKQKIEEGISKETVMKSLHRFGRDNARTPVQWNNEKNAGFTTGKSWINCNENYKNINVKQSINDENSIFNFYKKLISLRKENETLIYGKYKLLLDKDQQIYSFIRKLKNSRILIISNFSENKTTFIMPASIKYKKHEMLISNYNVENNQNLKKISLNPFEARIYRLF